MIDNFKKLFGSHAENYTKFRAPYPKALFGLLLTLIPKDAIAVLDVGCGTGKSTEPLLGLGLEVSACDHDNLMIEEAKKQSCLKNLNIDYAIADAEHLPYPDNYFDVVTVGTAFHFFLNTAAISEIKRVLRPDGLLFVYWTLTVKDIPEEDEIPSTIYKKYNWIKIPSELREINNISEFFKKSDLKGVSVKRIPVKFNTTVEERVGLQTTSGMYELLSTEDQKKFLDEVKLVLTKKLGSRSFFTLEEEVQVCWGFKS